jgi:hypothetical protein
MEKKIVYSLHGCSKIKKVNIGLETGGGII